MPHFKVFVLSGFEFLWEENRKQSLRLSSLHLKTHFQGVSAVFVNGQAIAAIVLELKVKSHPINCSNMLPH